MCPLVTTEADGEDMNEDGEDGENAENEQGEATQDISLSLYRCSMCMFIYIYIYIYIYKIQASFLICFAVTILYQDRYMRSAKHWMATDRMP